MAILSEKPVRRPAIGLGCYLYAVINASTEFRLGAIGLDQGEVYTISDGEFAAVVTDMPNAKIRPERRRLAAHHEVLKRLCDSHSVLPMAFGVIAENGESIRRILAKNHGAFTDQLGRVAGKTEMGLRVMWDVPNIFEFLVDLQPELRALRDRVFRHDREPTHDEKIEVGRMFDRVLNEEITTQTEKVMQGLQGVCFEIKENKARNERDVMNLACLISKESQKAFEKAVFAAVAEFDNHYAFDINGPWPPHNFVEVELQM